MNKLRQGIDRASHNMKTMDTDKMKSTLDTTSKQLRSAMHSQYQNLPQYKQQLRSQYAKVSKQAQTVNTQVQQKFHEFSQSNPTIKHYHGKYQSSVQNLSQHIPSVNVKQSLDSTLKTSKKIAENARTAAKKISNTSQKAATTVSSGISSISSTVHTLQNVSPTKIATAATKPIHSTYRATQRILSPTRWTNKLWMLANRVKTWLIIYGCVGVASFMMVNQLSYMALLYMVRHRYDTDVNRTLLGMDMAWMYEWLNIPYTPSASSSSTTETSTGDEPTMTSTTEVAVAVKQDTMEVPSSMQDYNINADVKLTKIAYHALLYPRIGAAVMMTLMVGTPLLRIVMWFKR